jgi:hypothetical protein
MNDLLKILAAVYSTGFTFVKQIEIPWIKKTINVPVTVSAKAPTNFNFVPTSTGGTLNFDPGIKVSIPKIFTETTLKYIKIDLSTGFAKVGLSGFPELNVDLAELK